MVYLPLRFFWIRYPCASSRPHQQGSTLFSYYILVHSFFSTFLPLNQNTSGNASRITFSTLFERAESEPCLCTFLPMFFFFMYISELISKWIKRKETVSFMPKTYVYMYIIIKMHLDSTVLWLVLFAMAEKNELFCS